jgi:hypothetical protein
LEIYYEYNYICDENQKMRILHYISALFFAAYFLLAGTGYNVIRYCCNQCEDAGVEFLVHHSCEEIHHNQSGCCNHGDMHSEFVEEDNRFVKYQMPVTAGQSCMDDKQCEIKRVVLGEYTSFSGSSTIVVPELGLVVLFLNKNLAFCLLNQPLNGHSSPPPDNTISTGREILMAKQVLII